MVYRMHAKALVVGSGLAGLTAALTLADHGLDVILLTSGEDLDDGNSALAQGGIVFRGAEDSPQLLERDMFTCGWRHNSPRAVKYLAKRGPQVVQELLIDRLNLPFDRKGDDSGWHLGKEGGHSVARILHMADRTGRGIMEGLMAAVKAHPSIKILARRTAVDLLTSHHHATLLEFKYQLLNQCLGAYVLNEVSGQVETILADFTVLCTGGCGRLFLHTSNTRSSIGSALAMASRAFAKVMNVEYVQFHPTTLLHRAERRLLVTEALRGEGARLVNDAGEPFMQRYDPRADLAPRDIVTRAILAEMLKTDQDCVYLDVANYVKDLESHFPTVHKGCLQLGIDITKQPIPVVPAAHYFCGGVLTDNTGRTTLERLYAAGECACTGIHGANRLASTSLLECLLWGHSVGQDIGKRAGKKAALGRRLVESIPDWVSPGSNRNEDPALIAQDWATIRNTMWNYVGINRSGSRLKRAFEDLRELNKHIHDFYRETPLSKAIVDLFHGCQAAYTITIAAMQNRRSMGCHYRVD
ncbi:L-aspartate oxidase [Solidesulfovibrio sp.]|uniref:L-aspartate oxidase n=1 Tax=Solidesulfovibrio sp. TaxID=2910990 RepID=UPI002B219B60|nr:L-aspartate oxidase [Solidesulfovibrio sp.]MEA4857141.1 L-aspartate oxidase [Solidesulfovibrio sp.]